MTTKITEYTSILPNSKMISATSSKNRNNPSEENDEIAKLKRVYLEFSTQFKLLTISRKDNVF